MRPEDTALASGEDQWGMGPDGDKDVIAYFNETPELLALLYELDLLPDQHDRESDAWERIFTIANHWRQANLKGDEAPSAGVDDLAMLVRRLAQSLKIHQPNSVLAAGAMDYLQRHGLKGAPLREDASPQSAPQAAPADVEEIVRKIVLAVAEIPDRTSPEDWPEAMIVTDSELRSIVRSALTEGGYVSNTPEDPKRG